MTYSSLLLLGLAIGTWSSEIAWRASAPFLGTGDETPHARVAVGATAILGSALLITIIARQPTLSDTPASTWTDVLAACLAAQVWLASRVFSRLTQGSISAILERTTMAINAVIVVATTWLVLRLFLEPATESVAKVVMFLVGFSALCMTAIRIRHFRVKNPG